MSERLRLPPFLEMIPVVLGRMAEGVINGLAETTYNIIRNIPAFENLTEQEKRALAYAIIGDIVVSPIPSPLDTPLDIVVQDRIRNLLPEIDKYRRMATKVAESIPYLELLPNYTITVLATIREKEI